MTTFVYIDETGPVGTSLERQPLLQLAAVLVPDVRVRDVADRLRGIAAEHLGSVPADFEWHGHDLWHGKGPWQGKGPSELLDAFRDAILLLDELDLRVAHSTVDKRRLHEKYDGDADENAYRLALQFLLEKLEDKVEGLKVIIADEAKEEQAYAQRMMMGMQQWSWGGEVPGKQLNTVIDSLHFVRSSASPGVQLADLVAFILQRAKRGAFHPEGQRSLDAMRATIVRHTVTWREPWPT